MWTGLGIDLVGTFGYVAAMRYVDALVVSVAVLTQVMRCMSCNVCHPMESNGIQGNSMESDGI